MHDWQVKLQLEAMAIVVRVEGMKAENIQREHVGASLAWDEYAFYGCANEIESLAREMVMR